ncbi:adenosylmethionine--8-amino-7-oxononanoate transaminase [Balneolaceae bacterium YR4-1]|uniref:Adenosylmethionine-8-amino-7-oxononanoate aminotransferase n=1 Tax=Halalkalibaculum roseum TaxID=2709311 RepID=A0A6M1SYH9_9BACT|nr:adenosylmethionine--8-amino-7-oxononanoate transaminase [Halalkalibaculum roseum]NGP76244.1 adenosylmethionine--8-amino-7-oxononanoate transaminase [Halalkalibaculum roseum]
MHRNIWYPFTIIEDAPEPIKVQKGDGLWLELEDGRRIMDCISSWWVNLHGHAHPQIAKAIADQASKLEQVIFANFSHDPAEKLAEKVTQKLPGTLNRMFFSDDGSTAVEVAMKMAYQYWRNIGQERKTFICFEGAYHGDTFGAMSAGERSVFTEVFKDLLFDVEFVPYPATWIGDPDRTEKESKVIEKVEELLKENPEKYAGIMIEPLVQGAGGMNMCSKEFLQELHWVNRQFNTLLIFDEVMTGFGRTGDWFACKRAQVEPDIICLAKGLTGGFLPLSVTVCSDRIYEAFNSSDPIKTFWHGHSYTANPIGCAAALASYDLMVENESIFSNMEEWHLGHLEKLKNHPKLKKLRVCGTIAAMDISAEGEEGYLNPIANHIKEQCVDKGLLLRPLGNVLYLMPPYCTTKKQLAQMYEGIVSLIDEVA